MSDEYDIEDDDLKGGSGGGAPIPRGSYTFKIEKPKVKRDKNGIVYLAFQLRVAFGKQKNRVAFENYLPLGRSENGFQLARRNSFARAICLKKGDRIPGAPGAEPVEALADTLIDAAVEHEFQNVPGQKYSLTTSKSAKSPWVIDSWELGLDAKGNLERDPSSDEHFAEAIKPRETVTFYALADEFEGLGSAAADAVPAGYWSSPQGDAWSSPQATAVSEEEVWS